MTPTLATKPDFLRGNPCTPAFWANRELIYTDHARERAIERTIPISDFLPTTAKLVDTDADASGLYAVIYKISDPQGGYFVVLSVQGVVITVFRNEDYATWHRRKECRRRHRR